MLEYALLSSSLGLLLLAIFPVHVSADREVSESRKAAPEGSVRIENLSGSVTVEGWNRSELSVTGTLGDDVERLDITGDEKNRRISVKIPRNRSGKDLQSVLRIRLPVASDVHVETVSADIDVSGIEGILKAETVSGAVAVDAASPRVVAGSVSGEVRLRLKSSEAEVTSVSGSVSFELDSGEVRAESVSGRLSGLAGKLSKCRLESVSGKVSFDGGLEPDGSLRVKTLSGGVVITLPEKDLEADFQITTGSGNIVDGFGHVPTKRMFGKTLNFSTGSGRAKVSVETLSGSVELKKKENQS